jgi:hypothetical protein
MRILAKHETVYVSEIVNDDQTSSEDEENASSSVVNTTGEEEKASDLQPQQTN